MGKKQFFGIPGAGVIAPPPPRHMDPFSATGFFERQGIKKNYASVNAMTGLWNRKHDQYAGLADFLADVKGDKGLDRLRTFLQEVSTRHTLSLMDTFALFLRWTLEEGSCNPAYQQAYPEAENGEKLRGMLRKELEERGDLPGGAAGARASFGEWLGLAPCLPFMALF